MNSLRSRFAGICSIGLTAPLAPTSCSEAQACPAIAHLPFIEATVYGDTSELYAVTACPLDTLDCVAELAADGAVKYEVGRYDVTLGYA